MYLGIYNLCISSDFSFIIKLIQINVFFRITFEYFMYFFYFQSSLQVKGQIPSQRPSFESSPSRRPHQFLFDSKSNYFGSNPHSEGWPMSPVWPILPQTLCEPTTKNARIERQMEIMQKWGSWPLVIVIWEPKLNWTPK